MKILILCTGNSCRSQMAEFILKSFDSSLKVFSAGTTPAEIIHPLAILVMKEIGITISPDMRPKGVEMFLKDEFDYVITVCDGAKESCPVFTGRVKNRIHLGFEDPALAKGNEEEVLNVFRNVRDQIKKQFFSLYLQMKSSTINN